MKILYICHRFPFPPKRGGKIRPFNMIRHFNAQGHEVTVASLVRSKQEGAEADGIHEHVKRAIMVRVFNPVATARMVRRLPTREPSSMGYFFAPQLKEEIDQLLAREKFDLIFVHCSSVAQYVAHVDNTAKILDYGDMDSQKWLSYGEFKPFPLSLGYYLEGMKLQLEESNLAKHFDLATATTRMEKQTLDGLCPGTPTGWFPNGVDPERFQPGTDAYDPNKICFVGRMDYYPNQEAMTRFCEEVWTILKPHRPKTQLMIVGADPSPQIRALADKYEDVTVTGSVEKVQPYVQQAALTVAPLAIARGTQNKILESLAMGVPVVASELACGGVDCVPEEHILTARTPDEYVRQILRLLDSPEERQRFSLAGRQRMLSHHTWASSMKRLDSLVAECLERHEQARRTR